MDRAGAEDRPRDRRVRRRRVRRPGHRRAAGRGRRRRAHHREGRRLRRHLVLEPLSRRAVRHRLDGLHAAAGRDRAHADGEVRPRPGDPRALPAHRPAVRPLRQRAVPHRGHGPEPGTRHARAGSSRPTAATGSPPSSSGSAPARCTCRSCPASRASGRSGATRSTPAGGTTTTPAAIRTPRRADGQAGRQAGRHHRHRGDRGPVRAAPGPGLPGAVRVPAHAVVGRRAGQPPDRSGLVRRDRHAGLAAALAGELHRQPGRRDRGRGPRQDGWTDIARRIRGQDRPAAAGGPQPGSDAGRLRGVRLREDGGDPRPGRRHRPRPGDRAAS